MQDSSKAKDPFKSRENGYINHVIRNCTTYVKQAICKVTCSQGPNKSRKCEEFFLFTSRHFHIKMHASYKFSTHELLIIITYFADLLRLI